ncbi:hypothetical protein GCM10009790_01520 [Georgenia ruanii]|uniref:GTPase n=1 Tax=Georgenia ruanii TaxID=348442 RepID=UPI0031D7943A
MTTTLTTPLPAPAGAPLTRQGLEGRADALAAALTAAGGQVDPFLAAQAHEDLAAVRRRLELGGDHTVVALVGGTGSGKSSLFNAISGLLFADVGALRPTTDEAAACVWGGDAEALLDFLQVAHARRIQRESVLDGDHERALHGMVLLDLPDHDSVARDHAEQVDRLLPMIDLLVWVVDPQKYADNALHERYLQALRGRQDNMLVLVNQADTLPTGATDTVLADVRELLAADGLDVEVLATSAVTGAGIGEVRERLARAVARPSTTLLTAAAEVEAVGGPFAGTAAAAEAAPPDLAATGAALALLAGTDALAAAARAGAALPRPEEPAAETVAAERENWLAGATAGLPPRWADAVDTAVAPAEGLRAALAAAVAEVTPPARGHRATRLRLAAAALGAAAAAYLVLALLQGVGPAGAVVPGLAGLAAAGVLLGLATSAAREEAAAAAAAYTAQVAARTAGLVEELLARPAAEVLARHRRLREALGR